MLCLHELQESDFTINILQYSNMDAILKQKVKPGSAILDDAVMSEIC